MLYPKPRLFGLATLLLVLTLSIPAATFGAATTVREPAFGLPHIYADTDLELARENGREIAKDRLGQIILLARAGRGNLYQAFSLLDPGTLAGDIETRRTFYTSSELNQMYAVLPQTTRDIIMEYCKGVNDTIDQVFAGTLPEPVEVDILRNVLGLGADLFGNATNISDQVDPNYLAPGGADPERPNGGFQFTPEVFAAIAVLQVREFGNETFSEADRLEELQDLEAIHGGSTAEDIWLDLNFLVDPLAPVSVPNSTSPGFGGPLAALTGPPAPTLLAAAETDAVQPTSDTARAESAEAMQVASKAARSSQWPDYDYTESIAERRAILDEREQLARRLGAWPALGSYSWVIAANKSATGNPWLGGFPQTGIQTPSVMHFAENRSSETIKGIGMEFAGAPAILIGQTDTMAWTSTTAQLRVKDTFFETLEDGDTDTIMYDAEGTPAPLIQRTESFPGVPPATAVFWRSHETNGNGGTRPIIDFIGDAEGTAESGTATDLVDSGASFGASLVGGYVAIVDGTGAGQMREITAVPNANTLQVTVAWTTSPDATSVYVATDNGNDIIAVAEDASAWMEETTTALAFSLFQQGSSVLDARAYSRLAPSTHNFPSVDNQTFNGVGTDGGSGNIAYFSSGFSRKRPGDQEDKLLPLDGGTANPLVVVSGTVDSATASTLTATAAFTGQDFSPEAINFRYDNPASQGSEYVVAITSGTGFKQTRRIASNTNDALTLEYDWGLTPANGDTFEVYEIVAMPEVINPSEGYTANWNNKATASDDGTNFGRNHRNAFLLERLAAENAWNRTKQRQLNKDLAGLDSKGAYGRYLVPRLREAFDDSCSGDTAIQAIVEALEDHNDGNPTCLTLGVAEECGRTFVDPVTDTTVFGEESFLEGLITQLFNDIYGDELAGINTNSTQRLALVIHAIDDAAGDVPGSYTQEYSGDYFNGSGWESTLCASLGALAGGGIPADAARANSTYNHPLAGVLSELSFDPTPFGNRGTYEQIVEAGSSVDGEFIFPLGQSALYEGGLGGITSLDANVTTLHPLWRDWRFAPMLHVGQDLAAGGDPDPDGDGVWDGYERWYFGDTSRKANDDSDGDKLKLIDEFLGGTDPTDADTDDDGIPDGADPLGQDRLQSGPTKLKGLVKFGDPGEDFLKLVIKFGTGSSEFDPNTNDIEITVSDDDEIFSATIPFGTMEEKKAGRKWKFSDKTGTTIPGVSKVIFSLGKAAGKPAKIVLKTIKMDLSSAEQNDHEVSVDVVIGAHTIPDTRIWEFKSGKLKASKN